MCSVLRLLHLIWRSVCGGRHFSEPYWGKQRNVKNRHAIFMNISVHKKQNLIFRAFRNRPFQIMHSTVMVIQRAIQNWSDYEDVSGLPNIYATGEKFSNFFYFLNSICEHYSGNLSFYVFKRKKLTADGNHANTTHSFVMNIKYEVVY